MRINSFSFCPNISKKTKPNISNSKRTYRSLGIYSLLLLSFFYNEAYAQKRLELGTLLGGSFYQGDILGTTVSEIAPNTHASASLMAGYSLNRFFTLRSQLGYGKISGGDKFAELPWRRARNLSFSSVVYNAGLRGEFNITGYNPAEDENFTLYALLGYNHLFHNPKAEYQGKWYELQPLGTEGQGLSKYPDRKPYALNVGSVSYGGGIRLAVTPKLSIGIEFSTFRTFTDYLDDVAGTYVPFTDILQETGNQVSAALSNREGEFRGSDQIVLRNETESRGNQKVIDYMYQFGLTATYNIYEPFAKKAGGLYSGKRKKKASCPKFK